MDGPALMGLPTLYLTNKPNVRLGAWVEAAPALTRPTQDDLKKALRVSLSLKRDPQGDRAWKTALRSL